MTRDPEYVWIPEERVYGLMVSAGAYYSRVVYSVDGTTYEVVMDNNDFEYFGDYGLEYYED